jgi:hypothetical protein
MVETKPIKDYENYLISTDGTITKNGIQVGYPTVIGYIGVCLSKNNTKKYTHIHRLVAMTFIPNPENKREVDHIDRDKTNNKISNLRWCSPSENARNKTIIVGKNKYTGISWCKTMNKYRARIKIQRKETLIGYADTENEAAEMYNAYLIKHNLNIFWSLISIIY